MEPETRPTAAKERDPALCPQWRLLPAEYSRDELGGNLSSTQASL
jgi:hypothetical protein